MVGVIALCATAGADPKPSPVDIKAFKGELIVLQDAAGGSYVVRHGSEAMVFYGTGKTLYQQVTLGGSSNGDAWSINTWAPRIPQIRPAAIDRLEDGTYHRSCDGKDDAVLTQLTGDKAKAVLDKYALMSEFMVRRPHLLARDDAGVYYYVDRLQKQFGGKAFRVFVGKKGAMKQVALTDIATDTAGDVYSTKTGDLRLVRNNGVGAVTWIKGEKRSELVSLDLDANSPLIFSELGIYKFMGTLCDNI
ncbi:MAG: hypothetical protein H6Q90_274 [Deltaproteobacteria bacterium]|nr:hypothetical protein [Deltaproteobacteria bacterium]